ncbi:MAG: HutD family protein [Chitinophagaceae bacterium]|nr:HutD family protein [Oligoflexus sp.]
MTLKITHHTAADYQEVPWNDGGSFTSELMRFPTEPDAKQPFIWQLNITKRESRGEFGKFPGYDRFILQLGGKTITLRHTRHGDHKLTPLVPYAFKGDWTTGRGLIGKAEDFNCLVRSERLSSKIERVDLKDRKPLSRRLSRTTILWVYQGSVEWECSGERRIVNERETLAVESNDGLEYILKSKRALCFFISIEDKVKP